MAHTLLYTMGYNAPDDPILPGDFDWSDKDARRGAAQDDRCAAPWTIDFHVAQNDATVDGSGSHDKTGRHCQPLDPNGKLDIVKHAGYWLRDANGKPTKAFQHICWDGCMFPNEVMGQQDVERDPGRHGKVRDAHGWTRSGVPGPKSGGPGAGVRGPGSGAGWGSGSGSGGRGPI